MSLSSCRVPGPALSSQEQLSECGGRDRWYKGQGREPCMFLVSSLLSHAGRLPCAGCGEKGCRQSPEELRPHLAGPISLCSMGARVAGCGVKPLLIPLLVVRQQESLLPPQTSVSPSVGWGYWTGCAPTWPLAPGRGCCRGGAGPRSGRRALFA